MNSKKLLSIIIPTYNMEQYLPRCLDSLVNAKDALPKLEILVINDGSKDSSSRIAHRYQKLYPDSVFVIDKENGNYGSCVNRGLKEATGKYIKVLDADDWFDTTSLNFYLNELSSTEADLIITDYCHVNIDGDVTSVKTFTLPRREEKNVTDYCKTPSFVDITMHAVTYKTKILKETGYKQTEGISYSDHEWVFIPMNYMRTFIYYDIRLYMYLLGREGQTVAPAVIAKSVNQRVILAKALISSYEAHHLSSPAIEFYLKEHLKNVLRLIYKLVLIGRHAPLDSLESIENGIRKNKRLYDLTENIVLDKRMPYRFIAQYRKRHSYSPWYICALYKLYQNLKTIK